MKQIHVLTSIRKNQTCLVSACTKALRKRTAFLSRAPLKLSKLLLLTTHLLLLLLLLLFRLHALPAAAAAAAAAAALLPCTGSRFRLPPQAHVQVSHNRCTWQKGLQDTGECEQFAPWPWNQHRFSTVLGPLPMHPDFRVCSDQGSALEFCAMHIFKASPPIVHQRQMRVFGNEHFARRLHLCDLQADVDGHDRMLLFICWICTFMHESIMFVSFR